MPSNKLKILSDFSDNLTKNSTYIVFLWSHWPNRTHWLHRFHPNLFSLFALCTRHSRVAVLRRVARNVIIAAGRFHTLLSTLGNGEIIPWTTDNQLWPRHRSIQVFTVRDLCQKVQGKKGSMKEFTFQKVASILALFTRLPHIPRLLLVQPCLFSSVPSPFYHECSICVSRRLTLAQWWTFLCKNLLKTRRGAPFLFLDPSCAKGAPILVKLGIQI